MTQPGGGSFAVDIARATKAIRELEQARDELYAIRDEAQSLGQVNPPTRDQVSLDAAQLLGQAGVGGPTSFQAALDQGITELTKQIEALRAGFAAYQSNDEASAAQLRQP
jgi:hypothetical protein